MLQTKPRSMDSLVYTPQVFLTALKSHFVTNITYCHYTLAVITLHACTLYRRLTISVTLFSCRPSPLLGSCNRFLKIQVIQLALLLTFVSPPYPQSSHNCAWTRHPRIYKGGWSCRRKRRRSGVSWRRQRRERFALGWKRGCGKIHSCLLQNKEQSSHRQAN